MKKVTYKSMSEESKQIVKDCLERNNLKLKNVTLKSDGDRYYLQVKENVNTNLTDMQFTKI